MDTGDGHEDDESLSRRIAGGLERGLELSRYVVALPVLVLVLAALGSFVYGAAFFVDAVRQIIDRPFPVRHHVGQFVVLIDLFLIGATLLIAAVGFYELFVDRTGQGDRPSSMPGWLVMRDLNDLKARVVSMLVLVAAVSFVDIAVDPPEGSTILYLGTGTAVFIGALTVFLRFGAREP